MADLTELQATLPVKLAGADSSGNDTNFVNANSLGELQTADVISGAGTEGALSVGTSAIEARVGLSALVNRKLLTIFNNSSTTIYWGRTSSVTSSTGTPIFSKQLLTMEFAADAPVFLIAASTGHDVRITESI